MTAIRIHQLFVIKQACVFDITELTKGLQPLRTASRISPKVAVRFMFHSYQVERWLNKTLGFVGRWIETLSRLYKCGYHQHCRYALSTVDETGAITPIVKLEAMATHHNKRICNFLLIYSTYTFVVLETIGVSSLRTPALSDMIPSILENRPSNNSSSSSGSVFVISDDGKSLDNDNEALQDCRRIKNSVNDMDMVCLNSVSIWSCKDRCGDEETTHPCSCHSSCFVHRMCCHDFLTQCAEQYALAMSLAERYTGASTTCQPSLKRTMISECPSNHTDEHEKELCQGRTSAAKNLFSNALYPVTEKSSQWTFKNVYCWRCWNPNGTPVAWTLQISRNMSLRIANTDLPPPSQSLTSFNIGDLMTVMPPEGIIDFRCTDSNDAIGPEDCDKCTSLEAKSQCGSYLSPVEITGKVYRNFQCYPCGSQSIISRNRCEVPLFPQVVEPESGLHRVSYTVWKPATTQPAALVMMPHHRSPSDVATKHELIKWQMIFYEEDDVSYVFACQPGVVNVANKYCHPTQYVWTLAMKLCALGQDRLSESSPTSSSSSFFSSSSPSSSSTSSLCDPKQSRNFLSGIASVNNTKALKREDGYRSLYFEWLKDNEPEKADQPDPHTRYSVDINGQSHILNVHGTMTHELEEVGSDFYHDFVMTTAENVLEKVNNGTEQNASVKVKLFIDSGTHEMYFIVLVFNEGRLLPLPQLHHKFVTEIRDKLWTRSTLPSLKLKLCKHAMPGFTLDLDVMAGNASCDDVIGSGNRLGSEDGVKLAFVIGVCVFIYSLV